MLCRDRTEELHSILAMLRARPGSSSSNSNSSAASGSGGATLPEPSSSSSSSSKRPARSEFHQFAAHVSRQLHDTTDSLRRLTQLIGQSDVFQDSQGKVQALSVVVKQKIAALHADLQRLQALRQQQASSSSAPVLSQVDRHTGAVVQALQAQLMEATRGFKEMLETRTEALKETQLRRSNFTSSQFAPKLTSSLFSKSPAGQDQDQDQAQDEEDDLASGGLQLVMQAPNKQSYYGARRDAVRQIEATITELGTMFQEFARVVQEQDELILRIDEDIETTLSHVERGQSELLRTLHRISGNRWLIIKIFSVLFLFIVFFGLFVLK